MRKHKGELWPAITVRKVPMPDTDLVQRDDSGRPVYAPVAGHCYGAKLPAASEEAR